MGEFHDPDPFQSYTLYQETGAQYLQLPGNPPLLSAGTRKIITQPPPFGTVKKWSLVF